MYIRIRRLNYTFKRVVLLSHLFISVSSVRKRFTELPVKCSKYKRTIVENDFTLHIEISYCIRPRVIEKYIGIIVIIGQSPKFLKTRYFLVYYVLNRVYFSPVVI